MIRWGVYALALAATLVHAEQTPNLGRIAGTVVDARAEPVRGAIVKLTAPEIPGGRAAISDDKGTFSFDQLPAGRFSLTSSKPAYLPATFGAVRPGGTGTPLALAAGQQLVDVKLTMPHGGAIAGVIRDANGVPMAAVPVYATLVGGTQTPTSRLDALTTDDRGAYRIFGLPPGSYLVYADPPYAGGAGEVGIMSVAEVDVALARLRARTPGAPPTPTQERSLTSIVRPAKAYNTSPVFFSGVASASAATPIVLGLGEAREGVDFVYQLSRSAAVTGSVTGTPAGQTVQLSLTTEGFQNPLSFGGGPTLQRRSSSGDGDFTFTSVTPGKYTLTARSVTTAGRGVPPPSTAAQLFATTTVEITGDDVAGFVLALRPTLKVSGRVIFDGASPPAAAALTTFGVRLLPPGITPDSSGRMILPTGVLPPPGGALRPDGTFELTGVVPGRYRFTTVRDPEGWMPKSAVLQNNDLFDGFLEIGNEDVVGIDVTLTDRRTQLAGRLTMSDSSPATAYFVVAFSTNRAHWESSPRRSRSARPGTDGEFRIDDLPAGEYYLAALTDADSNVWQTAGVLEKVIPSAIKVTLMSGERKVQDLRIGR